MAAVATGLLSGKLALVTGGGRGIGKAIAESFAKNGATVVIADINKANANSTKDSLPGENHSAIHADITSADFVEQLVSFVQTTYSRPPNVLVNNAGVTKDQSLLKMAEEQWDWVLATNLKGPFLLTQAVVRALVSHNKTNDVPSTDCGSIINISSVVGKVGNFGQANYASAKAGLIGLTKTVAREMGPKGIRCNAVLPGYIQTDMTKAMPENILPLVVHQTPLGRLGEPQDVADVCVFLASDLSRFVTGTTVEVTGGLHM